MPNRKMRPSNRRRRGPSRPVMDVSAFRSQIYTHPGDVMHPIINNKKVYSFCRTATAPDIIAPSSGNFDVGAYKFSLSQLPDFADFTALFDQYRITWVRMDFLPLADAMPGRSDAAETIPTISTVIDFDDANLPGAQRGDLLQYTSHMEVPVTKGFSRSLVPRAAQVVFQGGVASGYAQLPSTTWIDCANSTVEHYGVKTYLNDTEIKNLGYTVRVKYHLQFRLVR